MSLIFEYNTWRVYQDIRKNAPKWLTIMGYDSYEQFDSELQFKRASIVNMTTGYLILDEYVPGVRLTVHPCFTCKPCWDDLSEFQSILTELLSSEYVHRVQVRVFETAGHTIRKVLQRLGFIQEAVLQNYARDLTNPLRPLISSEVWSIVK